MIFPRLNKIIIAVVTLALIVAGYLAHTFYQYAFAPNVAATGELYIPTGADFEQTLDSLRNNRLLINEKPFVFIANKKHYNERVSPGHYTLTQGMNTNSIVNMLLAGNQTPVQVTFNNVRYLENLAAKVAQDLALDSATLVQRLTDPAIIEKFGFTRENFICMFIPNTYEMYWTATPDQFIERMHTEYERFWTDARRAAAAAQKLTPVEASILASIVQGETNRNNEKPIVAGLYLNRLRIGMPLQADPTVQYLLNDPSRQRILTQDLHDIDSPYNTYKYTGLPPGPISCPEISSLNATLNPAKHDYLFMVQKDDFSGNHVFTKTLQQHNIYAARYHKALNERKIFK